MDLVGKKVLVVGLARSGVAAAKLCAAEGAAVTVTDRRSPTELKEALTQLEGRKVVEQLGGHDESDFLAADLVVVSPGVPLSLPELAAARKAGVEVIAEVELAWRYLSKVPFVAITGTNGKSTTTALTGAMCRADRRAFVGGNLGTPLCEQVLSGRPVDVVVAELSSFQLEGIVELRPHVAAVLNVAPDHLDRYFSVDDYAAAKARIFMNQRPEDFAVANERDARTVDMAGAAKGTHLVFGFGPPEEGGCKDDGKVLSYRHGGVTESYRLDNRALRGKHNRENAMASVLCARLAGVPATAVQNALDQFPGLPHRLELIAEKGGVEWVNDSKATNVDSTQVGLAAFERGVILIMGGRGKGAPYAPLRELFPGRVKALLTIGEDAGKIAGELGDLVPPTACGKLDDAVAAAKKLAQAGDVVLLSPACASYDQFKNYEERGDRFRRLVKELT